MADVRKMFLQVKVASKHQNVHRFLWRNMDRSDIVKDYCMTRLPFGDNSSPYLAIETMRHHSENSKKFPEAAEVIKNDMYVDDCLTGVVDEVSAFTLYQDLVKLMNMGGFALVKWTTKSKELLSQIPFHLRVPNRIVCLDSDLEPLKPWEFHGILKKLFEIPDPQTKLNLVSISSKLFDPLGFLSPFTIRAKMLCHNVVQRRGLNWDKSLTEEIKKDWKK